jgi:hypothetical protein
MIEPLAEECSFTKKGRHMKDNIQFKPSDRNKSNEELAVICLRLKQELEGMSGAEGGVLVLQAMSAYATKIGMSPFEATMGLLVVLAPSDKRATVDAMMKSLCNK